ncbi:MAG TPA: cation:proton antiporter [Chitinophagaceae bacterium]|nr:cation:proton antiporter [Chitinophagaceae bacterium]
MQNLSTEILILIFCGVIVVSYLFSIISRYIKIPSVLLLLAAGIALRYIATEEHWQISFPPNLTEFLGIAGLVMIVLEAGLDLKLSRGKLKLIRNSFFAALFIFILSAAAIAAGLYYWLNEEPIKCIVYAIPLSIMSSSIVIPSLHHLSEAKKEFLVYEASFSDILGILAFNYFTAGNTFNLSSTGMFGLNIIIAIVLSVVCSLVLFFLLTRSLMNIRFFLVFALLIMLYEGGKMMNLPSLLIILVFGLLVNNWEVIRGKYLKRMFPEARVQETVRLLHSITAETAFLIRTFFFILFGFTIDLKVIGISDVMVAGSIIVAVLLLMRFLYLKFFLKGNVYPETLFIPRGLITILLFYKIPAALHLDTFNDSILFFVIIITGFIMMLGVIFYRKKPAELTREDF